MRILCNEAREERAGVGEDPSHGFVAWISARYLFLKVQIGRSPRIVVRIKCRRSFT
jgi:hypothetical protein